MVFRVEGNTIFANHTVELLLAWKNTYRGWEAGRERKNSYIFNLTNIGNLSEGNIFLFLEPNFLRKKKNMYTQIFTIAKTLPSQNKKLYPLNNKVV